MRYGDIVKCKTTGAYGVIHYSAFGASVHLYDEETHTIIKTLGDRWENIKEQYEVLYGLPDRYEWDYPYKNIKKIRGKTCQN